MERLTEWNKSSYKHAYYPRCFKEPCYGSGCKIKDCPFEIAVCERLAAYEDPGLTPEEIKAPFTEDAMINLAAQALGVEADRLRELAEADKDGRVSVLPCKPRADMINKILPGSTYLMERVHFAVAYVNKGNIYIMTQRTFEGGVKNGTIVSAATERAMQEMEGKA